MMALSKLLLLALVAAVASWTFVAGEAWQVHVEEKTSGRVCGSMSKDGETSLQFHVHNDDSGYRFLSLARPDGGNLLAANWTTTEEGINVNHFRVMGRKLSNDLHEEQKPRRHGYEMAAFDNLRSTEEFKSLPILSQALGNEHKLTGLDNPAALSLHRLALNAEKLHGTWKDLSSEDSPIPTRVKRCDLGLNPWSDCSSNTFSCDSPSGTCANKLLDYTSSGSCNYRGTPITQSDYSGGCFGMCGPGCYNCWTYICGDCCKHPGCSQHDGECTNSYANFDCLTAKGVLWGTGDSQYSDNC